MRISMVSEHASPLAVLGGVDAGGQNVHVAALSTALAAAGHLVTVYTRRDDPTTPERVPLAPGVEVVNVTAGPPEPIPKDQLLPFMPALAEGLAADWQRSRPEIVHSHFWMSGVAALDAARRSLRPVPVVHTFHALGVVKRRHQGAEDTSPAEREFLEPWVGRSADAIIATCSDEAFELKTLGVDPARISVAPCGVDVEHFTPDGEAEQRGRPHRIMTVGRLVPRKGVDLVIEALGLLTATTRDDVELMIVGGSLTPSIAASDPEVKRLLDLAEGLGIGDRVRLRGQVNPAEMPAVLRSADIVVCAPWYEPFGIVPLEAMACGVPVIASAVGGLTDSVVNGVTGLLVPPRDPDAIAAAVADLLADPARLRAFGDAGRVRVRGRYSWTRVAAETARVYRQTIARTARPRVGTSLTGALR
ncbi:glycosyl transferase [Subtercola sp. Z020]|uniref:glycosyltransferase n=1 Tax=Subtercola sp. Z020 TaxID=2080582 RepID=UPI000CE82CBC|nr:glycosyltransferase [Subtercola sp. Z020]PPF87837.1 glycosyl transferase [Subtercola sp. Z020]